MKTVPSDEHLYGWHLDLDRQEYDKVLRCQHGLVKMRQQGFARDTIITVEHPPVITVGVDGHEENFAHLQPPPLKVERGGDVTYHGPGQLVVYFIFNLTRRGRNLRKFLVDIQDGIVRTLKLHQIRAIKDGEHTGVWVKKKKIASIGLAVRKWITFHGAAINLNTDLDHFKSINPCGLEASTMTTAGSLTGNEIDLPAFAAELVNQYNKIFGITFCSVSLDELAEDIESQAGAGHV